jgi:Leucine-rich repeat (LRR) protein
MDRKYDSEKKSQTAGEPALDAGGIPVCEEIFPDPEFRKYVSDVIDKDGNGRLSADEIRAVKEIRINGPYRSRDEKLRHPASYHIVDHAIRNLAGIGEFIYLRELRIRNCGLERVDLSKNELLAKLDVTGNRLRSIDLRNNPKLFKLYCSRNELTGLNVEWNTRLDELVCSENRLKSLTLIRPQKLWSIDCSRNELEQIDFGELIYLCHINCSHNRLERIDLTDLVELREMDCSANRLKEIVFGCERFRPQVFEMSGLNCSDNELTSLDFSGRPCLMTVFCARNRLSALDLRPLEFLKLLDCSGNRLTSLEPANREMIEGLDCRGNRLTEIDLAGYGRLRQLYCGGNELRGIDVSDSPKLKELECPGNALTALDVSRNPELEYLDCSDNAIRKLDLGANLNISSLECDGNGLEHLDISKNPKLRKWTGDVPDVKRAAEPILFDDIKDKVKTFAVFAGDRCPGYGNAPAEGPGKINARLARLLRDGHVQFVPLDARPDVKAEPEEKRRFVLVNIDFTFTEKLAQMFDQESFVFAIVQKPDPEGGENRKTEIAHWRTEDGGKTYTRIGKSNIIDSEEELSEFISRAPAGIAGFAEAIREAYPSLKEVRDEARMWEGCTGQFMHQFRRRALGYNGKFLGGAGEKGQE